MKATVLWLVLLASSAAEAQSVGASADIDLALPGYEFSDHRSSNGNLRQYDSLTLPGPLAPESYDLVSAALAEVNAGYGTLSGRAQTGAIAYFSNTADGPDRVHEVESSSSSASARADAKFTDKFTFTGAPIGSLVTVRIGLLLREAIEFGPDGSDSDPLVSNSAVYGMADTVKETLDVSSSSSHLERALEANITQQGVRSQATYLYLTTFVGDTVTVSADLLEQAHSNLAFNECIASKSDCPDVAGNLSDVEAIDGLVSFFILNSDVTYTTASGERYLQAVAVPEPSSGLLLLSGLLFFVSRGRLVRMRAL